MSVHIVIGKNFGDEGKGLAVDYLAALAKEKAKSCIVIRHNGGAQAGHTVDLPDRSFIFHQLSSGSFRQADTFWSETYLPDFYKLSEEKKAFEAISGIKPIIYASAKCRCVTIDDVLINMAIETTRGAERHGSCGMGINEAVERSKHLEYKLSALEVKSLSAESLAKRLAEIRKTYLPKRLEEYHLSLAKMGEYGELLQSKVVLINAAESMCRAAESVEIAKDNFVKDYDDVIFEGAQGLLLDENYISYAPYLTSSCTGLHNPITFCRKQLPETSIEAIYVTRAYMTRHGFGPLPNETELTFTPSLFQDKTNIPNPWQGMIRYALHGTPEEFVDPVWKDINNNDVKQKATLMITHLNETNYKIFSSQGIKPLEIWLQNKEIKELFPDVIISDTPYSKDIFIKTL